MPYSWRFVRPAVLILLVVALAMPATLITAQDDSGAVVIQGTPELEALVGAIRDAYVAGAAASAEVTLDPSVGQRGAFEALCKGETDIVMSTEPISDEQIAACEKAGQSFVEAVLAYDAVVMLAPAAPALTCVNQSAVVDAWQLGAQDVVTWSALGSAAVDTPVEFYGPAASDAATALFAGLVPAGALREGITASEDLAGILAALDAENSSALGFMTLAQFNALNTEGTRTPLQIETEAAGCVAPSLETLADGRYPFTRTSYLYVNAESAARDEVRAFIEFALNDPAGVQAVGAAQGVTVPGADVLAEGVDNVLNGRTGRTFSRAFSPVDVAATQEGTVQVAGSALLDDMITPVIDAFEKQYANAVVESDLLGNSAGWASFCSGEADVLLATRAATDEELAQCQAAGIEPQTLDLGYQALVFVVPAANDWVDCLNAEQVAGLLRAKTDETPAAALWSDVDASWPERTLLLVAPPVSHGEADYIVQRLIAPSQGETLGFAVRLDMVERTDALYRAQGVANTANDEANPANGLTYLWWSDLEKSAAKDQLKVLSIDAGAGCVAPSLETFADGTYALSNPVHILVSQASFDNLLVQAFLWNLFSDDSLAQYARQGYAGLDVDSLGGAQKDAVYTLLDSWVAPVTEEPAPEATPETEPTAEPTATSGG